MVLIKGKTGVSGGLTAVECCCSGSLDEEGQFPHGCSSVNGNGVALLFKGGNKSNDRDGIARVEKGFLHLQLSFLQHLGYIARIDLILACESVCQTGCPVIDWSAVMLLKCFQNWKDPFLCLENRL